MGFSGFWQSGMNNDEYTDLAAICEGTWLLNVTEDISLQVE